MRGRPDIEVTGATWDEIDDMSKRLWSIPAERMKAGKLHVVPLSDQAMAVLDEAAAHRRNDNDAIFPGTAWQRDGLATLSNMSMIMFIRRLGLQVTVHGFRSTFRDWCGDHGHPRELAEACLAHAVGNAVEAAYMRSTMIERRTRLMQAWADHCCPPPAAAAEPVTVEPTTNIVAMPRKSRRR
jgi:integrase